MIAPLSSRPIIAGSAPPPCARQIRTPGRRESAPPAISAAAASAVSMGIPAPKPSPSPVTRGRQVLITRMDQHQGTEFMRDGKKPVQARVGQFDTGDLRPDLDAEESTAGACTAASRRRPDRDPAGRRRPAQRSGLGAGARSGRRTRFELMPVRPRLPPRPGSRTSPESAKALASQRLHDPCRQGGHPVTNTGDRSGDREPHRTSAARRSRWCARRWASGRADRPAAGPADHRRWRGCGHRRAPCGRTDERRWSWLRATNRAGGSIQR